MQVLSDVWTTHALLFTAGKNSSWVHADSLLPQRIDTEWVVQHDLEVEEARQAEWQVKLGQACVPLPCACLLAAPTG